MRTSKTVDETASTQDSSATQGELPRFEPYESPAGGWGALQAVANALREQSIILKGSRALIELRLARRTGHFMNKDLLQSQFETLEEPADAIAVDVSSDPDSVVNLIRARLMS